MTTEKRVTASVNVLLIAIAIWCAWRLTHRWEACALTWIALGAIANLEMRIRFPKR